MSPRRRRERPRRTWLERLTGRAPDPEARRAAELEARLDHLRRRARHPALPSDHRAFLREALERLDALRAAMPGGPGFQALALNWQESVVAGLERQAGGLPGGAAPFATSLPTTRAEEQRRHAARAVLESAGRRIRAEREELLAMIEEVERGLAGDYPEAEQASPRPSPSASA